MKIHPSPTKTKIQSYPHPLYKHWLVQSSTIILLMKQTILLTLLISYMMHKNDYQRDTITTINSNPSRQLQFMPIKVSTHIYGLTSTTSVISNINNDKYPWLMEQQQYVKDMD
eukprot:8356882-Ditylum_brightwellii.AAC.1